LILLVTIKKNRFQTEKLLDKSENNLQNEIYLAQTTIYSKKLYQSIEFQDNNNSSFLFSEISTKKTIQKQSEKIRKRPKISD